MLVICGAGYALYRYARQSDRFLVSQIEIQGNVRLTGPTLIEASGVKETDNVLFLDVERAEKRIESLAYVKRCRVDRGFPDTVLITVEERRPAAVLLANNGSFEIDAECVVLRRVGEREAPEHAFISQVPDLPFIEVGQQIDASALRNALDVLRVFSETTLSNEVTVSEIAALGEDDLRLYCNELEYEIRWGRGDFAEQAQRLDLLWQARDGDLGCTEYLDLRFGPDVACR